MWIEIAAPTEKDIVRLLGVTPADLGLKKVDLVGEKGVTMTIFPMSLHGIPMKHWVSIRKLRLSSQVRVSRDEMFVTGQNQIAQEQPANWLNHLVGTMVDDREKKWKLPKLHDLTTWESANSAAQKLRQERQAVAGVLGAESPDSMAAESDADEGQPPSLDAEGHAKSSHVQILLFTFEPDC